MRHGYRIARLRVAVALVAGLTGCANLEGVRDFTASSARITAYRGVTDRALASPDYVLLEFPAGPAFDAFRAAAEADRLKAPQRKEALLKLQSVATGYMAALAKLAGDDSFDLSGDIGKVSGQIALIPDLGITAAQVSAYTTLAQTVTNWATAAEQARDVKALVLQYGEPMDTLLHGMETATAAYIGILKNEQGAVLAIEQSRQAFWQVPLKADGDPRSNEGIALANRRDAILALSRRSYAQTAHEEADAIAAAQQAARGVRIVRTGHAEMLKNIDRLDNRDVVALLKKAAADLKAIRSNLKAL
ncbi:MAG: hypothetical protein ABI277_09865 [Burkholderiaceae bacterium]